jgi:hypothetical protein
MTSDSKLTPRAARGDTSHGRPEGEPAIGEAPAGPGPATSRQVPVPCEGNGAHPPEQALAKMRADLLSVEQVPVDSHSSYDLGAGDGCTLDVGAFVHYGVTVGDGAALAKDRFRMTGEVVPQHSRRAGNPARGPGRVHDHAGRCGR